MYLILTLLNVVSYYNAVRCSGDFDYYGVYLQRALWLNYPVRVIGETLPLPFVEPIECVECIVPTEVDLVLSVSQEILVFDFVLGTIFWLFMAQLLFVLIRHFRRD